MCVVFNTMPSTPTFASLYIGAAHFNRCMVSLSCPMDDDCPICTMSLKNKTVIITPCGHVWHLSCQHAFTQHCVSKDETRDMVCCMCRQDLSTAMRAMRACERVDDNPRSPPISPPISPPMSPPMSFDEMFRFITLHSSPSESEA